LGASRRNESTAIVSRGDYVALGLFQWIGIGLGIALVLIPIVRWFWKRFDMPSKWALEYRRRQEKEEEEAEMWASIESRVEAEESSRREFEMKQKQKQRLVGKSLDEKSSAEVWNKLGIDAPIKPVKREEPPPVSLESDSRVETERSLSSDVEKPVPEAPDWELVDKMSKLSEPVEGVPEAPDLEELSKMDEVDETEPGKTQAGWADDW